MIDKGEYIKLQQRERARKRDESLAQKGSWEHATSCNIKKKKRPLVYFCHLNNYFSYFPPIFAQISPTFANFTLFINKVKSNSPGKWKLGACNFRFNGKSQFKFVVGRCLCCCCSCWIHAKASKTTT